MTDRVSVTYTGTEPVSLHPGLGDPVPATVDHGESFEIDKDVAERLSEELFVVEGPVVELTDEEILERDAEERPEPLTIDEQRVALAEVAEIEPEDLKGAALDEELRAAGLSTSGLADEKRERLAAWQAVQLDRADGADGNEDGNPDR